MGKIYCIIGRSATGKSTVEKHLEKMGYDRIISTTTRPMRDGERNGFDYNFISDKEFNELLVKQDFYEQTTYNSWKYSICKNDVPNIDKQDYICVIEVNGFKQLQESLGTDKVIPILLYTDSYTRLKRAIEREPHAEDNVYVEVCRRYLSDFSLFSDFEKLVPFKINNLDSYETARIIDRYIKTGNKIN
jgi:guanylate kinase